MSASQGIVKLGQGALSLSNAENVTGNIIIGGGMLLFLPGVALLNLSTPSVLFLDPPPLYNLAEIR